MSGSAVTMMTGSLGCSIEPVEHLEAWHAVHPETQADDVGTAGGNGGERDGPALRLGDVVAQRLEQVDEGPRTSGSSSTTSTRPIRPPRRGGGYGPGAFPGLYGASHPNSRRAFSHLQPGDTPDPVTIGVSVDADAAGGTVPAS